jgi:diguanylate cyclase (GGDEF)-like protein/putative nucleotidyltransferase with HDIG domain
MIITNPENKKIKQYHGQILTIGVVLSLMIFTWELATSRGVLSYWVLAPLTIGIYLIDTSLEIPLMTRPLYLYHGVITATLVAFDTSSATLVAIILFVTASAKTYYRFSSQLYAKLLKFIPALLAVWIVGNLYAYINAYLNLKICGSLFPVSFVVTGYYLLYTLLDVVAVWLVESVDFRKEWKTHYLVPTQLILSIAVGIGLVNHFTQTAGAKVYLLAIPFALFALTTYKIYSENLQESSRRLSEHSQLQMSIIETLALAIDAKDHSTHGHVRRVQVYAVGIARSLGIENSDDLKALRTAALLHDIGKLAIPEYILSKPGKLTDSEFSKMVRHVEIGANILEPIHFPYPIVPIIRHHHERHDGTGYPHGLKANDIPLGAKILAVADTFDALTAHRPYRNPMSVADAIALIERESGTSYDPEVVKAFSRVAEQLAQEVALLDTTKHGSNTHLPQSAPDSPEERKLWLRKKGFTEIASTHREIYTLYEIFQTVGKSLNAEDTMRIICTKLQSLVPFSSCVIYLRDKKTDAIYPAMATGDFAGLLNNNSINLGEGLSGYAIAFNQPVVNSDPSHDFKNIPYLERPHQLINSLIFPLKVDDNVFGAIALYSSVRNKETYSDDHVRLMETVSSQAAISIQNALSFESYEANSLTDPLTGLPNSRFMFMAFEQNVKKAERFKDKMTVLVMDLNGFKEINDKYGHKVGDEVLIKVSGILQKEMRKYDTCIRYAGDEFVAFLYNADREVAEKIVARIKKSVQALVVRVRSGKEVRLGISVGMSMYPDDGSELNQLFTVADSQMYNDKFESKAGALQQDRRNLKEAIVLEDDIQFQRVN